MESSHQSDEFFNFKKSSLVGKPLFPIDISEFFKFIAKSKKISTCYVTSKVLICQKLFYLLTEYYIILIIFNIVGHSINKETNG